MTDPNTHPFPGYPPAPGQPPAPAPPQGGSPPGQPPANNPTHDELAAIQAWGNSFAAREKAEGRASVEREIAEKLGCTLDEAAEFLKKAREADQASMTEAQRLMTQAQEKDTKATAATQAAHQMIYDGLREDALVQQGMSREQAKLSRNLIHIEGEVTVESVVAAAERIKLGFPQMFNASPPPPSGDGGGNGAPGSPDRQHGGPVDSTTRGTPTPGQGGGQTAKDRALARLRSESPTGRLKLDGPPPEMDYRRSS